MAQLVDRLLYTMDIAILALHEDAQQGVLGAGHRKQALDLGHLHIPPFELGEDALDLVQIEPGWHLHNGQNQVAIALRQIVDGWHEIPAQGERASRHDDDNCEPSHHPPP